MVVIDGQQRLTTVSILMLALSRLIDAGTIPSDDAELGRRIRRSYLLNSDDSHDEDPRNTKFRLKPVKNDADAYQRLFEGEQSFIDSSNITANYRYFLDELPKTGYRGDELWEAIRKLEVMHLDLEPHDDPQRIFESLNSTGLELSEADKIRNLVLMKLPAHEQNRVYEKYWNRIEESVDYQTSAFLRWYLVTKNGTTPRSDRVYEAFKAFATKQGLTGAALLTDVRDYADYHCRALTATTGQAAADAVLQRLNMLKQDVALPLLMPLIADYRTQRITGDDLAACIKIVASYLLRRFVCDYATNSLNKVFATTYREIRRMHDDATDGTLMSDVLAYSLQRRTGSATFPDDKEFREAFLTRDFYHLRPERRRYIFDCRENQDSRDVRDIATRLESGSLSIEHIMPQTLTTAWRDALGDDADEIHETWLHRIGNLTVTGYNSAYSNASFSEKLHTTDGFLDSPYRLNRLVKQSAIWGPTEMQQRAQDLAAEATRYWVYPTSTFHPQITPLPSTPLGDDTPFTNERIAGYEFTAGYVPVGSWRDLLVRVLQECAASDRNALFAHARETGPSVFSIDGSTGAGNFWEVIPGLGVQIASSTYSKVEVLRRAFAALQHDPNDLVLTLRPHGQSAHTQSPSASGATRFGALLGFIDRFEPLHGSDARADDTASLRDDFIERARHFDTAVGVLGAPAKNFASNQERMATASTAQICALITATVNEDKFVAPGALHRAIVDGTMTEWLRKLRKAEASEDTQPIQAATGAWSDRDVDGAGYVEQLRSGRRLA